MITLTPDNLSETINGNDRLLVLFTAGWCKVCPAAKRQFGLVQGVPLAICDLDVCGDFAQDAGVRGLPAIGYWVNGELMGIRTDLARASEMRAFARQYDRC